MRETTRIVDQLNRAFYARAWHGPSVMEVLKGVTATQAAKHLIPGAHSIWELAHHIGSWNKAVRCRILGEKVIITSEDNFPTKYKPSPAAWKRELADLVEKHEALVKVVAEMPDDRLSDRHRRGATNLYVQIHGVVQHDIYHAGQIALIKKALRQRP